MLLAAYLERRRISPMPWAAKRLAGFAGVLFAGDLLFWHNAIDQVGAGLATVLGNLQVVIVAIAAWLIWGERPNGRTLIALPIILTGVVLIAGVLGGQNFGANPALGGVLGIGAALTYAGYLIVIRQVGRGRVAEPVVVSTTSTLLIGIAVGVLLGRLDPVPSVQANIWLAILGVTAQGAGYLLISISLPRLPAVMTSIILLAQPVLSVILGVVVLGEAPSAAQLVGVGLVIGGISFATVPLHALRRRVLPASP